MKSVFAAAAALLCIARVSGDLLTIDTPSVLVLFHGKKSQILIILQSDCRRM
jgi:hypothetical protein